MPSYHDVEDPLDPRIDAYRDIRERDLVGRQGLFVAEGEVVLAQLVRATRYQLISVLIDKRRRDRLEALLEFAPRETPVFCASQAVLDQTAGFPLHRGILAIGAARERPSPESLIGSLGEAATIVALYGIANHDNLGGIFRNAAAFGVGAVLLDAACCDPLYRKALRVSVGAVLRTPYARLERGDDGVQLMTRHGFAPLALTPAGAMDLADLEPAARTAVLLGPEGPGLAPELIATARSVRISMAEGMDSLNVATTSGIVLHHLARGAVRPSPP